MDGFLVVKNRLISGKFCLIASYFTYIIAHGVLQYKIGDFWAISSCFGAESGILTCFFVIIVFSEDFAGISPAKTVNNICREVTCLICCLLMLTMKTALKG